MLKRLIDFVVAVVASLLTLPLVFLLSILVAVELRAWPLFVHERVGLDGRPLRVPKLRTLPPSTPRDADKYALATVQVPPICRRLRRLHLDELPQLWLVVTGRMSLVGPRPEMARLHARFDDAVKRERTSVRPGCTGLWQVSVASGGLMHEHPEYDLAYVRAASLYLDLWIMWRTVGMLAGRPRRVTLAEVPLVPTTAEVTVLHVDAVRPGDSAAM